MQPRIAAAIAAVFFLLPAAVHAQPYPLKPIRFIISFGPGSASDALARIAGQELSQSLGQPIVVLPKPGADGALSGLEDGAQVGGCRAAVRCPTELLLDAGWAAASRSLRR